MIKIKRSVFKKSQKFSGVEFNTFDTEDCHLDFKHFVFSGGEVSVKLNDNHKFFDPSVNSDILITAKITSSEEFMKLAMIKDAIERRIEVPTKINLFCPYFPNARQDRIMVTGEAFTLKVFANMVNSLKFNKVIIVDPHSNVTPALIDNVKVITQCQVIQKWKELTFRLQQCSLVAPDGGAVKKTEEIAAYLNQDYVRADKKRDLNDGKILETIVYCDNFNGRDAAICDDIAENSGTFILLAKVLKTRNCGRIVLYATHGLFPKGVDYIFEAGISEIWTTNSFRSSFPEDSRLKILDIDKLCE